MPVNLEFRPELQLRGHDRVFCDSGAREKVDYMPVYDKQGVWHLEETGKTNLYLEIQSHAASCDINVIMARYAHGETDVLQQIQNSYGDASQIPTNYADIMNMQIKARDTFYGLSADVRAKFDNSVEVFMSKIGTREGLEALGYKFDVASASAPAPASAPASADGGSEGES